MLTLNEVKVNTDRVFSEDAIVPEPPIHWKDKLEALEEANLSNQRTACLFDMRKWQASKMGFEEVNSNDLVKLLMGEEATENCDGDNRQTYEWTYNHHDDAELKDWGGKPTLFRRVVKTGLWHMPPFSKKVKWVAQFGKLNYLKREIPYGVVLRINECKQLKLFNCFNVIAPKEAWERKADIDPIVVATIWELPISEEGKPVNAGQAAHYFLAQW